MGVPPLPQIILLFFLGGVFLHFLLAGSRTLYYGRTEHGPGAIIAEIMFVMCGTIPVWFLGLYRPIPLANGIAAAVVLLLAIALYEWARQTIWGRRFGVGWGQHVPEAVCADGPYRFVRHPLYLSYLVAYLAALVALPHWLTAAIFVLAIAVFANAAHHDEQQLADSPISADYAAYRARTGMFLPRFKGLAPVR